MKNIYIIVATCFFFLIPVDTFAWGHEGHHIVAQIAQSQLSQNIQDSVKKYLGTMSFDDAATWMDDVRSDHNYDFMKSWHYIDIEKDQTYIPNAADQNCTAELQKVIKELNSKLNLSKDQINNDIKVLFHLVGDIGQPLHCGYPNDKGGNSIHVTFLEKNVNLHHVWDSGIIFHKKITTESCQKAGIGMTKLELSKINKIDVIAWMNDSRNLLPEVYDFQNGTIDENYIEKNAPIIERQIFISGSRLAGVLTQIFSK